MLINIVIVEDFYKVNLFEIVEFIVLFILFFSKFLRFGVRDVDV